jgi:protein-S-isoprenylcysteine O-methyltransferase Ste14
MTNDKGTVDSGPGVVVHPPLLFVASLLVGFAFQFLLPLRFVNSLVIQLAIGLSIIIVGFGLGGWAVRTLVKAEVDPRPHSPVKSLVVTGPFRLSRNPIYLSGIVLLTGAAFAADTLWLLLMLPVALGIISLQVSREEKYLEARFGEEYRKYTGRVRRWL